MRSQDFDEMYEHGRSREFKRHKEGKAKRADGESSSGDDNVMTFGSRPPTAPQKKKQQNEFETPMQSAMDPADNSMVYMGAITVDKKNDLIGNAFQQPDKNIHEHG